MDGVLSGYLSFTVKDAGLARKILLADDSVTAQNMGRKILTDAGYDVITVNNGSAALKRVSEQKPDLIVLDVYMPGYSGLEVCARLKDAPETMRIPILLTVGKLEPFKPEEARRVNADAFIVKPFEASELLSALTRLEDRMVPQAEGARFSTSVSGIERFGSESNWRQEREAEPDSGWKNRLRFPSKKKKEEPEPEVDAEDLVTTPFRDFRRGPAKPPPASAASPPVKQEPGLVPDIPRDITPEELDALSALAAKLDGPIPAENVAPLAEKVGPPPEAPVAEEKKEFEVTAPAEVASAEIRSEVEAPATSVETKAEAEAPVEAKGEAEVPAAPAAEQAEVAVPAADVAVVEAVAATPTAEAIPAAAEVTQPAAVAPAAPAEAESVPSAPEAVLAPVDKNDEPLFASAGSVVEPAAEVAEEKSAEVQEVVSSAVSETAAAVQAEAAAPIEVPRAEEVPAAEAVAEGGAVAASPEAPAPVEGRVPSEEELAEALRALTPSPGQREVAAESPQEALAAAGEALAEEAARSAPGAGRWVAESVELSAEEASVSLEGEMFRTFRAGEAGKEEPAPVAEPVAAHTAAEDDAVEAAVAAAEEAKEAMQAAVEARTEESPAVAEPGLAETIAGKEEVLPGQEPVEASEEVAATTFADAVQREETEAISAEESAETEEGEVTPAEGEESMGKETKTKSDKAKWHQIHSTPAPAAKSDVVEAAKQADARAEESPKAMAAAAAADGGADATAIASIVDSVLADLKPKIVEEIAKKLGKK